MPAAHVATAADYADAMMIARRAKNWLVLLLLLMLLFQMGIFFATRYTTYILPAQDAPIAAADTAAKPTTAPAATTQTSVSASATSSGTVDRLRDKVPSLVRYLTAGINFLGIVFILLLAVVLSLIMKIMLVGRLIGVAQVTSAFIWCALLALLLFPWQSFLQNTDFAGDFKVPGVLYTWSEYANPWSGARFTSTGFDAPTVLHWARFVGWPALALIILLAVQAKSSRGLRAALGETELDTPDDLRMS
jgi:hypothetical protein